MVGGGEGEATGGVAGYETLAYRAFTDYGSRLAVVRGTHLAAAEDDPLVLGLEDRSVLLSRLGLICDQVAPVKPRPVTSNPVAQLSALCSGPALRYQRVKDSGTE